MGRPVHRTARVQSLDRGLAIIEALARERRLLGIREIADELEVSHSTASRLAATLRDRGFLDQERDGGRYALGLRLTRYARLAVAASALEVAARPVIEMLVEELGETVSLGIPVIGSVMVVWSEAPSEGPLRITLEPGTVVRYTSSAAGRAILAAMSPAERDAVLPLGWQRRTTPGGRSLEEFVKELAKTIVRGHAIELAEGDPEVASVAVAVHDDEGHVIGALSCSMPIGSASTPRIASVAEALSAGASDIAARRARPGLHRWSIPAIDSISYWTPDLEPVIDELEERLGVRPARGEGGRGTAVLSIGGGSYLLVIGPDTELDADPSGLDHPSLRGWSARVRNFDQCVEAARAAGADFGPVRRAGVDRTDRGSLRWRVAAIDGPLGDLFPRLVDWSETEEHPAATSPGGVKLVAFRGEHPEPELIRSQLDVLGLAADLEVTRGPEPRLWATLEGPNGRVELSTS